jgi:hypothetical protein
MAVAFPIRPELRVGDDIVSMRLGIEPTITAVSDRTGVLWQGKVSCRIFASNA